MACQGKENTRGRVYVTGIIKGKRNCGPVILYERSIYFHTLIQYFLNENAVKKEK